MSEGFWSADAANKGSVWAVGSLVRAIADALASRFNPVAVRGEISGFSRAASGHCYFSLKDESGQLRCAMFRRAAERLAFVPREGQLVEVRGKLDVYGPRGDLQLIVDSLQAGGQGALFEQFLKLKAQLEAEGWFDTDRKRALPPLPRSIGVVTSLGAAALRDVVTALRRRVPHLPVTVYPAAVQGVQAPAELCTALRAAYARHAEHGESEVLLLVRGGGSLEDLWAFNDAELVRTLAQAPMPVICGVGHETDFTLADFVADLRAPTPTAAAELCAPAREQCLAVVGYLAERLQDAVVGRLDRQTQRLDLIAQRLGRPSSRLHRDAQVLAEMRHRMRVALDRMTQRQRLRLDAGTTALPKAVHRSLDHQRARLQLCGASLGMLDPQLVLERGYAYLTDTDGQAITGVGQVQPGQSLVATLADGQIGLKAEAS